jgi:hypothetical protein
MVLAVRRGEAMQQERLPEIAIEQVDIRRQREGLGMMPEPPLHLYGVAALGEQEGRAGVAEGVETRPMARTPPRRQASTPRAASTRATGRRR